MNDDPGHFNAACVHIDGRAMVSVRGEIDLATEAELDAVISAALQRSPHIVLDLADMGFMDSAGLRSIIKAKLAIPQGGSLEVRDAPDQARKVFQIAGLTDILAG